MGAAELGSGRAEYDIHSLIQCHGPFDAAIIMAGTNDFSARSGGEDIVCSLKGLHAACWKHRLATLALTVPCSWVASREGFVRDAREDTNRRLVEWAAQQSVVCSDTDDI